MHRRTLAIGATLLVTIGLAPASVAAQHDAPPIAGTYALLTIDGHATPYAPNHPGRPPDAPPPPTVVRSLLTVSPDGTFSMTMRYRMVADTASREVDREFSGSYTWQGAEYMFSWTGAGQTAVTLRADTLLLNNVGMLFAYVRDTTH